MDRAPHCLVAILALSACSAEETTPAQGNNTVEAAEVEVLPADESATTSSEDLANGTVEPPAENGAQ